MRDKLKKLITEASDKKLSVPYISEDGAEALADYLISKGVVVPVRCGDCKCWKADGGYGLDLDGTKRQYGVCAITNMAYKENHFCCFGAKRSEE